MAGWNVGGAYRWQDEVGIGRPIIVVDGAFTSRLGQSLFFGPTEDRLDAWIGWETADEHIPGSSRNIFRVQLNVRNLMDKTDPYSGGRRPRWRHSGNPHSRRTHLRIARFAPVLIDPGF